MSVKEEKINVFDMTCTSCESRVEKAVIRLVGVKTALASFRSQSLTIEYDTSLCNAEKIKVAIRTAGYSTQSSNNYKIAGIFIIVAAIILIGNSTGGIDMTSKLNGATYFVLFTVGVLTSIHCVGMCGGIMLSQSINKDNKSKFDSIKPALLYNVGRVLSYTVIGGIVGALGSVLSLSIPAKAGLQIFAGVFMIIMGLNMSGFSLFRKFIIKLPRSACSVKKKPKTPFLIGFLNGLMPCGPLQTMQLYALGTGSAFNGALSMLLFSLGTVPLMLTFGALSGLITKGYTKTILKFSGILVVVLGIVMGSRGLALAGINMPSTSTLTASLSGSKTSTSASTSPAAKPTIENGVQIIRMTADGSGYTPNGLYVQKNMPVKWIIDGKSLTSCNGQIIVPSLNIQKNLQPGDNIIEFTPKDKDISFSCGMGMIRGVIKVVDNIKTVDASKPDPSIPTPSSGMACCGGGGTTATTTPKKASIYGSNLSKVETSRLIQKAVISGSNQALSIKGTGYEFEPLIIVATKDVKTILSFDLNGFDNPDGTFEIAAPDTGNNIATFKGKKGTVKVSTIFSTNGIYSIIKDGNIVGGVVIVDDLKNTDLEKIRKDYIGG